MSWMNVFRAVPAMERENMKDSKTITAIPVATVKAVG